MNCETVRERLIELLSGTFSREAKAAVEAHLAACGGCRAEREKLERQEALLRGHFAALRAKTDPRDLAARAASRAKDGEAREPQGGHTGLPAEAPACAARGAAGRSAQAGPPLRFFPWKTGAAAAALLVAFLYYMSDDGMIGPPPAYGDIQVIKKGFVVTAFNRDLALVRDLRQVVNLRPGVNRFRFEEVPARLDPTSVKFHSETDPTGCKVLEQNFEYDLVSREKILSKYVDKEVSFERVDPKTEGRERLKGTLLSPSGQVRMPSGEVRTGFPGEPILPELPGGLLTRPALSWVLAAPKESRHEVTVSYLTGGISWHADYIVTLKDEKTLDLAGWVSLTNESGATYPEAQLKLIAGDVHRAEEPRDQGWGRQEKEQALERLEKSSFIEKSFFEYHLYALERPTTLRDRETKQIDLLAARSIPYKTESLFDAAANSRVQVVLSFKNSKDHNAGMPLPAGSVRVTAADRDGETELVGRSSIDHTPKDEEVRIPHGVCFDIAAERKVVDQERFGRRTVYTVKIVLRNHAGENRRVTVLERMSGDWRIVESTDPHKKKDAFKAEFEVEVPADSAKTLTYSSWEET